MFSEIAPWLEMTPAGLPRACRGPAVDHFGAPNEIGLEEICLRSDQAGPSGNAKMHHGSHRQLPADSKVELIFRNIAQISSDINAVGTPWESSGLPGGRHN